MTRASVPHETAEGSDYPTVCQLSVFLENRVGQLLKLTQLFEQADIAIIAVSVVNSVDCAIIRLIVDEPAKASQVLRQHGFVLSEADLLAVVLPPGKRGLLSLYAALVGAEVSIHYTYPLLVQPSGHPAVALQVDDAEMATRTLKLHNFELLDQGHLEGLG